MPSSLSNSFVEEDDIAPVLADPNKPEQQKIRNTIKLNLAAKIGQVVKAQAFTKAISDKAKMKEVQLTFHNLN